MSLVKRARLVVAAVIVAVSGAAVVAPQITAAQHTENGGGNNDCYAQVTEYRYQREVPVYKTEHLYKKQTKTVVTHDLPGSDQDTTELVSDWAWWDAPTTKWSFDDVDVLESGDHWNWDEAHDGHTDHYDRDYRYVKTGESRQVLVDTTVEATEWSSGPPDGDGWEQIDKRTVKGDEIPCDDGETKKITLCHATSSDTNPYTRITVSVAAFFNSGHIDHDGDIYAAFSYVKQGVTHNVPANGDTSLLQYEDCQPPSTPTTTEPPSTPTTTEPPSSATTTEPPSTTEPTVRIAAVTPLCHKEAPYVEVTLGGDATFNGRAGTITFVDVHGTTVATHAITFNVGDTVRFLYPGATVDAQGNATDWPGWKFSNGQWAPDSSDAYLREGLTVVLTVNPADTAMVEYPAATAGCMLPENVSSNPPTPETPETPATPETPSDLSGFTLPETL